MYCSLEEAFGGNYGSNFLSKRIKDDIHPIHKKRIEEEKIKQYICKYGDRTCEQVLENNNKFNHQQKLNAIGLQEFPANSPNPQNYTFSPQYPWYPWARNGYLEYQYQHPIMVEHFVNQTGNFKCNDCNCKAFKLALTYFIFFLISLAIVMSLIMIFSM